MRNTSLSLENLTDFLLVLLCLIVGNVGPNNVRTDGDICLMQYIFSLQYTYKNIYYEVYVFQTIRNILVCDLHPLPALLLPFH